MYQIHYYYQFTHNIWQGSLLNFLATHKLSRQNAASSNTGFITNPKWNLLKIYLVYNKYNIMVKVVQFRFVCSVTI